MSYNSNASSNELNNNMEINNKNQEQTEMNNNNSNNNDSSNTSSVTSQTPKLSPNNSPKSNSPTSSSSSEESGKITSIESDQATTKTNMHHLNSYDYDDEEEDDDNNNNNNNNEDEEENEEDNDENNTQYNSSTDSNRTNINNNSDSNNNNNNNSNNNNNNVNNTNVDLSPRPVSAYERLTKSVRSFLNATRILRNPLTNGSPESSAAEENSSSNNQGSSPFSASTASTSSASPQSSSSSFQSGLSPPSMSSSNQSNSLSSSSSSSKNRHHYHHHHHSSHHHASSSSSSSLNKNVMNMTKKSNLFDDILKQFSENTATNRENNNVLISKAKPSHKINKKNLKNLLNIYKNNENYYTTMFFPITDNYKLESARPRRTFRASSSNMSHHHRSLRQNSASKKEIQLIKSNGEDSNDANEIETAYNKQKDETEAAAAAATASSSLSESPSSESSASSNNNNNNNNNNKSTDQKATNSNNNASNTSNGNQQQQNTKTNKKSTEFFTCPLCTHCLYEPITLVCGCTFCKNCLNEFNLTLIKLTLIKLAKRNAADSLNELDLFSTGKNKMDTSKAYSQEESQSKKCGGECQSDDEQNSISPSSSTASSSSSSSDDNSNSAIRKLKNLNLSLFKCFNCSKVHELNTAEYLKMNTNISTITEKLFDSKVEIRKLRNDIRRYIVLHLENDSNSNNVTRHFDLDRYETMLNHAYNLDKTNHLLLADLFMLNYFSGRLDKALDYANKTTELRPKWAFSYFMKSIYYQKISDLNNLRSNLIQTFQLDSSIEQIRYKIFQINYILLKPNHTQITDGKQALAFLKNKDLQDLTSIKRSASSFNFNQDSIQMSESSSSSKFPKISPHIQFQSKKRYHSSDTDGKHFSKNYDFKIRDSCESISTDQSEIPSEQSNNLVINDSLLNTSDLECSLCYRLFYNPVTTPCGHSYCCSCLERSLDYQDKCPLCKNSLAEVYLAERRQNLTVFLDSLIKNYFPKDYEVRKRQHLDELKELTNNDNEIPVFVCTTALPFASCPLHIYEPHYRLMLRRAIESGSKQFGMCMYSDMTPYLYTEYGCMLEIRNYQFTKDGRAVVATTGGRRFKVVHAYMKDGYNVAQIQWVTDIREETVEGIQELQNLHDKTYQLALKWYSQLPEIQKQKILEIYGELPQPEENIQANDNGPVWHWFLLNILPLENDFQYMFLTKTSLKERLKQIKKLLIFMLLIDRSRQVTPSTSSQNLYIQDNGEADN